MSDEFRPIHCSSQVFFFASEVENGLQKTAQKIRKLNSGARNFEHIEHGSTRRRLSLDEENAAPDNPNSVKLTFIGQGGHLGSFVKTELL